MHVRGRDLPLRTYLSSDLAALVFLSSVSEAGRTFANLIFRVWVSLSRVTRLVTFLTCDTCYITFTGHWDWGEREREDLENMSEDETRMSCEPDVASR